MFTDPAHDALPDMLRWLLASRDHRGAWGNTYNTFTVTDAMTDYLLWKRETEAKFTLRGLLGGIERFAFAVNPKTVFETLTHFVPINELPRNTLTPFTFTKEDEDGHENMFYYDLALTYYLPVEQLPPRDEGITITRNLYTLTDTENKKPLTEAKVGDVLRGKITLTIPKSYRHIAIEDFIPAGFELVNFNLATEDKTVIERESKDTEYDTDDANYSDEYYDEEYYYEVPYEEFAPVSEPEWMYEGDVEDALPALPVEDVMFDVSSAHEPNTLARVLLLRILGTNVAHAYYDEPYTFVPERNTTRTLHPSHTESHDDRVFLYINHLEPGVYEYEYYLRALVPGRFQHLPARAEELYFPEIFGRTTGDIVTVTE